jgi:hypothetical protein
MKEDLRANQDELTKLLDANFNRVHDKLEEIDDKLGKLAQVVLLI